MKKVLAVALAMGMAVALFSGCEKLKPLGSKTGKLSANAVKLEMYIMSKCPFGVQAVQGVRPAIDELGNFVDFKIDYIVNEANGQFSSLHGEPEVKGNLQQLCAMKISSDKWMAFMDCQNKNWQAIPEGWEPCAAQAGIDKDKLKSCVEGEEGKTLLRQSMERAKKANAQGSPTILVGGEPYNGGRSKNDFLRAVCGKLQGNKPPVCAKIPEDIEVLATILTDKRCKECQTAGLEANLKSRFFPKLKVTTLDYSDEAGKKLYTEMKALDVKMLPVMLFQAGVEKAERYDQISRWMIEKGKYKMLRIPANFDPTAEICDNKTDDNADGKVDCDDATCKESLLCRKEIPNKLDVFVMSQCPFGVQALDAMKEVLENFKGKVDFSVHFIADKVGDKFNALHGQPEVDENIRELCAIKYYGKKYKYMDYIWCRNKNIRSDNWQECAKDGIDKAKIEKCFKGDEGKKLLEEDIKIAKSLDVSGSPTWLANNKFKFSGIAADAIKTNICQHNKDLAGCDKKLTEKANVQGSCGN